MMWEMGMQKPVAPSAASNVGSSGLLMSGGVVADDEAQERQRLVRAPRPARTRERPARGPSPEPSDFGGSGTGAGVAAWLMALRERQ